MTRLADRLDALDKDVKKFGGITRVQMMFALARLGLNDQARIGGEDPKLIASIGTKLRKKQGDLEGIAWTFARHGIFMEHGVGKGRPIGSDSARAHARPWLKPSLETAAENLADMLESRYADIAAEEVAIRVPGVIDTKVVR